MGEPVTEQEKQVSDTLRLMAQFWQPDSIGAALIRPHPLMNDLSIIECWAKGDTAYPLRIMEGLNSGVYL